MKQKFNKNWKSSKQPRKQRKYRAKAPLNIRKNFIFANLCKDLRKKLNSRSMRVKKGDKVKVMRGKFKGKKGKVIDVNLKTSKITLDGMQVKKQDGSNVNIKFDPSNLQILELHERSKKIKKEQGENKK